jgi:hypothetical protein
LLPCYVELILQFDGKKSRVLEKQDKEIMIWQVNIVRQTCMIVLQEHDFLIPSQCQSVCAWNNVDWYTIWWYF